MRGFMPMPVLWQQKKHVDKAEFAARPHLEKWCNRRRFYMYFRLDLLIYAGVHAGAFFYTKTAQGGKPEFAARPPRQKWSNRRRIYVHFH